MGNKAGNDGTESRMGNQADGGSMRVLKKEEADVRAKKQVQWKRSWNFNEHEQDTTWGTHTQQQGGLTQLPLYTPNVASSSKPKFHAAGNVPPPPPGLEEFVSGMKRNKKQWWEGNDEPMLKKPLPPRVHEGTESGMGKTASKVGTDGGMGNKAGNDGNESGMGNKAGNDGTESRMGNQAGKDLTE
eukprot:8227199-Karenia_brevis.AAC.1